MTYDRLGRPAPSPADVPPAAEAATGIKDGGVKGGAATPNAARLARRGASSSRPGDTGKPRASGGIRRSASLRILPVTAFVAALVLSVKVADLWERRDGVEPAITVGAPAVAQNTEAAAADDAEAPIQIAQSDQASRPETDAGDRVDPFNLGKSQIELLQSLADRRQELEERERVLVQREGLLTAAEHRIEKKIGELNEIKAEIEALIRTYDEQEEEQLGSLVKIYETMKPKDAARIFDELDMDVLLQVIERMKASKTAPVLANMTPERAKEVTSRIAERRQMPDIN